MIFNKFKLVDFSICQNCSKKSPESDAKFCIFCGNELNHPEIQRFNYIYDKKPAIVVSLLSKVAKADSQPISKNLANFISTLLDKVDIFYAKNYEGFRATYAKVFEYEKNGGRSITELCSSISISSNIEAEFIVFLLLDLSYSDKQLSINEDILIEKITLGLNISILSFREIKQKYELLYGFDTKNNNDKKQDKYEDEWYEDDYNTNFSLDEAYKILKSNRNDSDETIKKNYRKLAREYHYDSLNSKELPPELLKIAQEMMKKINAAYGMVRKARGM